MLLSDGHIRPLAIFIYFTWPSSLDSVILLSHSKPHFSVRAHDFSWFTFIHLLFYILISSNHHCNIRTSFHFSSVFPFLTNLAGVLMIMAAFGIGVGVNMGLYNLVIIDVMGLDNLAPVFAVGCLMMAFSLIGIGPLLGRSLCALVKVQLAPSWYSNESCLGYYEVMEKARLYFKYLRVSEQS